MKEVSVILEKFLGNMNVQKLRVILLLKADFNTLYKIVFNGRIMPALEKASMIPCEIIGKRRTQLAIHLVLNKKLLVDRSNVQKRLIVIMYVDAKNYYDRVEHSFVSLCVQYFRLEVSYLLVLFRIIQIMKMFLHMFLRHQIGSILEGIESYSKI